MIEIRQHTGKNRQGEIVDSGIDSILIIENDEARLVGWLARDPEATIQIIVNGLAPSVKKEIRRAANERDDLEPDTERRWQEVTPLPKDEPE